MPENPTLEDVKERLSNLIKVSERTGYSCTGSLWITEAKVLYEALAAYIDLLT